MSENSHRIVTGLYREQKWAVPYDTEFEEVLI
jgi:hypothetical protein